jgi:hypothetical protein
MIFYLVFLFAFAVYSAMGVYHLLRFGYVGDLTKAAAVVYSLASIVVIVVSIVLLLSQSFSA